MPRRESEFRISSTTAPSTGPRRGRSRSPCRNRRLLQDKNCSVESSDSSGSERSGRHRRRRKSRGRSRSKRHRRHRRRSRDTDSSSESDSDDDSDTSYYESEGSRDRRRKRSKSHKSSKRSSRKSTSRKDGSRRKRSKRSVREGSGTPERAAANNAKSGNMAKGDAIARFVQQGERVVPGRGEVGRLPADEVGRFEDADAGYVMSGTRHAPIAESNNHGEKARREGNVGEGVGRLVDREIGKGARADDVEIKRHPFWVSALRGVHES